MGHDKRDNLLLYHLVLHLFVAGVFIWQQDKIAYSNVLSVMFTISSLVTPQYLVSSVHLEAIHSSTNCSDALFVPLFAPFEY